jgi:spermidine synthase
MNGWIEEIYKEGLKFGLELKQELFSGQSSFQKVEVFESTKHGRVLLNDGCFMLCERDERIYHEMMAHVPLMVHPAPAHVLIIGGGDGGTAREVLRHPEVKTCTLVEIDKMVVDACREYIPSTAKVFDDPRLKLHIEDGLAFVKNTRQTFDVVLVDSTDPSGPALSLFDRQFYADVAGRLSPQGIVVAQGESVFYETATQAKLLAITSSLFPKTAIYNFTNMTYPGGLWSFTWASTGLDPLSDIRTKSLSGPMHYYSQDLHRAAFVLPQFQKDALAKWIRI